MATIAGTRPTYYEVLGLTPAASDEEIRKAFAREISPFRPRAIGGLAEISIAYESLRDPARRRAYDSSIGIEPEPAPPAPRPEGWHHLGSLHVGAVATPAFAAPPAASPRPEPEAVAVADVPVRERRPEPEARYARRPLPELSLPSVEERPIEWRRPALAVGGLFAGVALLGAGLGWYASRDVEPAKAEAVVTSVAPKPVAPAAEAAKSAVVAEPQAERHRPAPPRHSAVPMRQSEPAAQPTAEEQRADEIPDIPTEQVAAQVAPAPEPVAAMPLSNAAIARTIGRIGYSCGSVASTSAVEGEEGVFNVTCTSGDSYRAAPVHGRYRFRRTH